MVEHAPHPSQLLVRPAYHERREGAVWHQAVASGDEMDGPWQIAHKPTIECGCIATEAANVIEPENKNAEAALPW